GDDSRPSCKQQVGVGVLLECLGQQPGLLLAVADYLLRLSRVAFESSCPAERSDFSCGWTKLVGYVILGHQRNNRATIRRHGHKSCQLRSLVVSAGRAAVTNLSGSTGLAAGRKGQI